jgi:hypothetical protein
MPNANDPFDSVSAHLNDPGDDIYPVTPDDDTDLPTAARALRANTDGTIKVTMRNGQARTLNFAAGEMRVGRFRRVWETGTTATGIEAHI